MKGDYEEFHALKAAKNKANSKPILFSPQIFWGLKTQFEKTKPICRRGYWRKGLYERILWQLTGLRSRRKQSQFKACPERSRMGQFRLRRLVNRVKLDVKRDLLG